MSYRIRDHKALLAGYNWAYFERTDMSPSGWQVYLADPDIPQTIPADHHDYAYTHGGAVFRRACEYIWDAEKKAENISNLPPLS
jgi:hypothetical protein